MDVSLVKKKDCSHLCIILSLLGAMNYLFTYIYIPGVTIIALVYLLTFYYIIVVTKQFEFYLFGLLIYKPFASLIFPFPHGFTIALLFLIYIPLVWFTLLFRKQFNIWNCKFVVIFLCFSLVYGGIKGTLSWYIMANRYIPLFLFVYSTIIYSRRLRFDILLNLLRPIFIVSLFVWILPNYIEQTEWLLCDYGIFGEPLEGKLDITMFFVPRNLGFYYDCRIFGVFVVLYFCIALLRKEKYRKFDLYISSLLVFSTTSRGAIVLWGMVLVGYVLQSFRFSFKKIVILFVSIAVSFLLILILSQSSTEFSDFLSTFKLIGDNSALGQREIFLAYALYCFFSNPLLGIGAGALKGYDLFSWGGGYNKETYITDSFLASTLGEIGMVGFVLFLLYIFEIYYNKTLFSVFLILGMLLQLLGTDVPDSGVQYFVIIFVFKELMHSSDLNKNINK